MIGEDVAMGQETELFYKARGIVKGQYFPSTKFRKGILITQDGDKIPCSIASGKVVKLLLSIPELLEAEQVWACYPRMMADEPGLEFELIEVITKPEKLEVQQKNVDYFQIIGEVESVDDDKISLILRRNIAPPPGQENWHQWQPFYLQLNGNLPVSSAVGKLWEFDCVRSGYQFHIQSFKLLGEPPAEYHLSGLPAPEKVDVTKPTALIETKTKKTITTGDDMAITGKLELTIKINAFPDDIKTTQNGWKTFEVDCDGQMVSITVKPKMFKKLEDAQATYPQWVGAIAGKMGAITKTGFVLEQPTIQVFERKPKEQAELAQVS